MPIRVLLFDQPDLPSTIPFLYLLLACYGRNHVAMDFEPDQFPDIVSLGEAINDMLAMKPCPADQIAGDACLQRRISIFCHYVNRWLLLHSRLKAQVTGFPPSRE
jgi:hypothetical protein